MTALHVYVHIYILPYEHTILDENGKVRDEMCLNPDDLHKASDKIARPAKSDAGGAFRKEAFAYEHCF